MQSFPEKDFDTFIRKAVEEPKLPFDPEAWKAMEKKLDARPGLMASGGIDLFSILALLILLSYSIWIEKGEAYRYTNNAFGNTVTAGTNIGLSRHSERSPESKDIADRSAQEKLTETNNKTTTPVNKDNLKKEFSNKNTENKNLNNYKINYSSNKQSSLPIVKNDLPDNFEVIEGIFDKNAERNGSLQGILSISKKPALNSDAELNSIKKLSVSPVATEIKPVQELNRSPKWGINFMVSPDLSAVNLSDIRTSGTNLGISFEYYLSSRWRISLGAIKSEKIYSVESRNSSGYGYYPQDLETVDASCSVIDIPLLLRYNALSIGKNHFFISSGFSSYLMLKEDYDFTYQSSNSTYSYTKNIRNENNHFFSIMNFSLGMEREIGRKFSLQAEPFIKAPISEIGYGKIKLLTTGAFISLKYRFY